MMLSERIKARRKELNLTQVMLSEMSGIPQGYISRYENGETEPLAGNVTALAKALQVSADWLLGLSEELDDTPKTLNDLDAQEQEIVSLFRAAPTPKKHKIIEFVRLIF